MSLVSEIGIKPTKKPFKSIKGQILVSKLYYIEDITRWREDMNFMFEWV